MQEVIEKEKQELNVPKEPPLPKREEKSFSFPIDFESDFELKNNRPNIIEERKAAPKISELYTEPKREIRESKKFKASPVISPVYGVLDKNYTKDEVKEKEDSTNELKRSSQKVDFESVRKKAFGNLSDDIKDNLMCENCELYKEVKRITSLKEDDILYDMTVDEHNDELTIEKAYDNYKDFGVSYEPNTKNSYKEGVNIIDHNDLPLEAKEVEIHEDEDEKAELIIDKSKQEEPEIIEKKKETKKELPTRSN